MGGAFGCEEMNTTRNVLVWWGLDTLGSPRQLTRMDRCFPKPTLDTIRHRYCYRTMPYHMILQPGISKSARFTFHVKVWINSGRFVYLANGWQKTIDYDAIIEIRDLARTAGHKFTASLVVANRGLFVASVGEVLTKSFHQKKRCFLRL